MVCKTVACTGQNFDWDCTNSLAPCNNACFAVNCKGSPTTLNYDSNAANRGPRRTASGCNRSPCSNTRYRSFGNACDEYPFASTTQGGAGAILRCVDSSENSSKLYNIVLNNQIAKILLLHKVREGNWVTSAEVYPTAISSMSL
jgi:hypothetical protein